MPAFLGDKRSAADQPDNYSIAVLRWEDEQQVAAMLARSFVEDPLVIAICDAPGPQRLKRMRWAFRVALRSHCLSAQPAWTIVDASGVPVAAVLVNRAAALVPSRPDLAFVLRGYWHVGLRAGLRGARAAQTIAAHAPTKPFTYLRTLGVDPDVQRCGFGSRLVAQVVQAAPVGLPVYLETAKVTNLTFYARQGFRCIGEFSCLDVPVWRLLRPPTAAGGVTA